MALPDAERQRAWHRVWASVKTTRPIALAWVMVPSATWRVGFESGTDAGAPSGSPASLRLEDLPESMSARTGGV